MWRFLALGALGIASCADSTRDVSSETKTSTEINSATDVTGRAKAPEKRAVPKNTVEELVFATTDICLPFVSVDDTRNTADFAATLKSSGYSSYTAKMRQQTNMAVTKTAEFFRKSAHDSHFSVAFGNDLPGCVVMLTDDSVSPPFEELRRAFVERRWVRSGVVGTGGQRASQAFVSTDSQGRTIIAELDEQPGSDPKVRLGINVRYVEN